MIRRDLDICIDLRMCISFYDCEIIFKRDSLHEQMKKIMNNLINFLEQGRHAYALRWYIKKKPVLI